MVVSNGPRAMHGAAIVPDHHVALAPGVGMHEARLRGVLDQVHQQQPAVGDRHADDVRGVAGDVERLAGEPGWRAHHALRHRRQARELLRRVLGDGELAARMPDRMLGHQPFELPLGLVRQGVVGRAQVGEFRLAAFVGHDMGVEHGKRAGHRAERGIGMPQPIGQPVEPALAGLVSTLQSPSRLEMSAISLEASRCLMPVCRAFCAEEWIGPKWRAKAICCSSSSFWS